MKPPPSPLLSTPAVVITSFITGTACLVIEILGTRLISPFFGNTVYVWSSLILVTLLALTIGYSIGGWLADRRLSPTTVFASIGIAGLWLALLPFLIRPVLTAFSGWGLAVGALGSAFVLFGAPLILLGTTGPQFIRLLTVDVAQVGRRSGLVYSVSTLGSVTGALLAGFVLIPHWGLRVSTLSTAAVLLATSAVGLFTRRRIGAAGVFSVALALALFQRPAEATDKRIVTKVESLYGQLKVAEEGSFRTLLINGFENSDINLETGETDFKYAAALEAATSMRPEAHNALLIGLGGGGLVRIFEGDHNITVDSVEIDPAIERLARTYFRFQPKGTVTIGDGRAYVNRTAKKYDLVLLDAYNADQVPGHLLTADFFRELKSVMNPGGLVAINFIRRVGVESNDPEPWECLHKSVGAAFGQVRTFSLMFNAHDGVALGHAFVFGSDGSIPTPDLNAARNQWVRDVWQTVFARELSVSPERDAQIPLLTDDYNPMELLIAPIMMSHRRDLLRYNPRQMID